MIAVVITLVVVGVLLWLVNTYGRNYIDGKILWIINFVVIVCVIFWLLNVFGVLKGADVPVPQLR